LITSGYIAPPIVTSITRWVELDWSHPLELGVATAVTVPSIRPNVALIPVPQAPPVGTQAASSCGP